MHLPAQYVEIVRRRRAIADLYVVVGTKLKKTFEPRRRMFWPLALIAVRQQHDQARHAQPFHLARSDKLVDKNLRAIGEIAELGLPQHKRFGFGERITVFEADHGRLREKRIGNLELRLARPDMIEHNSALLAFLIDQGRMALRERAARRILAGQAHWKAFVEQRAESQRLGGCPIDSLAGLHHLAFGAELAGDGAVNVEIFRHGADGAPDRLQSVAFHRSLAPPIRTGRRGLEAGPAPVQPVGLVGPVRFGDFEFRIETLADGIDHGVDVVLGHHAFFDQLLGINLQRCRMVLDRLVHQGLREGRFVRFVVPEPAITEHVDHDVLVEELPELGGDACAMHHRFGIIAVGMEDRRLHHQGYVGRVGRRTRIGGRCGEADLIVDDEMDRAAGTETLGARHGEALGYDALAGEGRIAVNEKRNDGGARDLVAILILLGARLAEHHRVCRFQM